MVMDPMTLDVEVEIDAESFEEQVAAAKRDLADLQSACEQANDALDRLKERDPITLTATTEVENIESEG